MVIENWESIVKEKIATAKARGSKKRHWVKFTKNWLTSSINYRMELCEQAVFSKLIVMADEYGPVPGLISDNDFRAMPHKYLAHLATCPIEIMEATLDKAKKDDSIYENGHGIYLTHFDDYQFTEYDRQKPYREAKKERLSQEDFAELARTTISGQSIEGAIDIAQGKVKNIPKNKIEWVQNELDRRGIPWKEEDGN